MQIILLSTVEGSVVSVERVYKRLLNTGMMREVL